MKILQRSFGESDTSSVRCYLEIWGSDIAQRFTQVPNGEDSSVMSRRLTTDSHRNTRQSPSELSIIENMVDLLQDIDKSDLVLPDHLGWLYHEQSGQQRWCIAADILLCVFEDQDSTKPMLSVLLPGADIKVKEEDAIKQTTFDNDNQCKYGFSVDSNIAGTEHVFYTTCKSDSSQWVTILKSASNLDFDMCDNHNMTSTSISRNSSPTANLSIFESEGPFYSEQLPRNSRNNIPAMPSISLESPESVDGSPSLRYRKAEFHLDLNKSCSDLSLNSESSNTSRESATDYADFRHKLQRDSCRENANLLSPVRALHPLDSPFCPQMSSSLDRRSFQKGGSVDHIDRLVLRKSNSNPPMPSLDTTSLKDFPGSNTVVKSAESADNLQLADSCKRSHSIRSQKHSLSQSLDLSKITPVTSGLVRKASGFKERMFGRKSKSTLPCVTLGSLEDTKMSGFLQHKVLLKWQKLFCVVSKGCLYAFKTKQETESPVFVAILSNYTITYLLNDKRKKQKASKPFVFKLSQANSKSIYMCAAHSLDLARWIQVLQMEASKVRIDQGELFNDNHNTSYDSLLNKGLFTKTNARYRLGSPCEDLNESDFFEPESPVEITSRDIDSSLCESNLTMSSGTLSVSERQELHSGGQNGENCPGTEQNVEIIAAWEESSSCSTIYSSTLDSSSLASLDHVPPRHDEALTQVWQQDGRYILQALRKQTQRDSRKALKKNSNGNNMSDIPGNAEGSRGDSFMVLDEESTEGMDYEDLTRKTFSQHSSTSKDDSGVPDPLSTMRKRHKPVSVRELSVKQLGPLDHSGYMEKRHHDGSWLRYWFCLRRGWLYCYLTPHDLLTVDAVQLEGFHVSAHVDKFPTKTYVLQLSHDHFFSLYFSVESSGEMNNWVHWITQGVQHTHSQCPSPCPSIDHQTALLTADAPVCPDSGSESYTDSSFDTSSTCSDSFSQARRQLLEHVLSLKHDLEKKQSETRLKRGSVKRTPSDSGEAGRKLQQEQVVHDITRLRQRRLSTQLKVETLQKHVESTSVSRKKPLFRFGSKQKIAEPNNNNDGGNSYVEEQMKELTSALQTIDKDLSEQEQSRKTLYQDPLQDPVNRKASLDFPQGQGPYDWKSFKDDKKRSQSLKVNASKLPASFDWLKKSHDTSKTAIRFSPSAPVLESDSCQCSERLQGSASNGKSKNWFWKRRDTKESVNSRRPNGHDCLDGHLGVDREDASSDRSPSPSPRREIDPKVLADIEAFEEMTKQILSKSPESDTSRQPTFV